jgi:hypothetical protein
VFLCWEFSAFSADFFFCVSREVCQRLLLILFVGSLVVIFLFESLGVLVAFLVAIVLVLRLLFVYSSFGVGPFWGAGVCPYLGR